MGLRLLKKQKKHFNFIIQKGFILQRENYILISSHFLDPTAPYSIQEFSAPLRLASIHSLDSLLVQTHPTTRADTCLSSPAIFRFLVRCSNHHLCRNLSSLSPQLPWDMRSKHRRSSFYLSRSRSSNHTCKLPTILRIRTMATPTTCSTVSRRWSKSSNRTSIYVCNSTCSSSNSWDSSSSNNQCKTYYRIFTTALILEWDCLNNSNNQQERKLILRQPLLPLARSSQHSHNNNQSNTYNRISFSIQLPHRWDSQSHSLHRTSKDCSRRFRRLIPRQQPPLLH